MGSFSKNALTLIAGVAMKRAITWPFDYVLYPAVLLWLGNVIGGLVMIVLATLYNVLLIKAYDWSKTDWLLIEKIKQSQNDEDAKGWMMWLLKRVKEQKVLTFLILSLDDPVTVTLYFRKGSYQYNGMSSFDWKIFLLSSVVSNVYWIIGWAAIIEIGKFIIE